MKSVTKFALIAATLASTPLALAHEAGDWFVRGGIANVMPQESSDKVSGNELKLNSDMQIGITGTYMYTDNIGFELLAATPFTHEVKLGGNKVAEVSHLPPSFMAQYYFGQPDSQFRPYLGAGLNYTVFFDEKGYGSLNGTKVSVDDSFGLALQAGVDFKIDQNWFANVSIWKIDIGTTVDTAVGKIDLDVDPLAAMASIGYSF